MSSKRAEMMATRTRKHRDAAARATHGFVRTPAALADEIVSGHRDIGSLPAGALVLEPSAGDGAIVREILEADRDAHVIAVEPSEERADALAALAAEHPGRVTVYRGTFEDYAARVTYPDGRPHPVDAVVMNPPFGDSQTADLWMSHVRTAWELLRPGCVLVAIVPASYATREHRAHREFRTWAQSHGATFEKLPRDAFEASGTGVSAGVLTIPRPMPEHADGLPTWLYAPSTAAPIAVKGAPWVTAAGALASPVQEYQDRSDGSRPRVIRYVGTCHGCGRIVWEHDDRGDASVWECNGVSALDLGKSGPTACLCLECATTGDRYAAAVAAVAPYWTDAPADGEPDGPIVYPGDLGAGCWATVRGVDARRWDFTITGRVMRDPEPVTDPGDGRGFQVDRVAVALRTVSGVDVELYALAAEPVIVRDAPADAIPAPYDGPRLPGHPETAAGRPAVAQVERVELETPAPVEPVAAVEPEPVEPAPFRSRWAQLALPV